MANPASMNDTEYVPGLISTIRYCPVPSVTTDRTFSIRDALDASTVTPGNTAPDVSFTTPVMLACAQAAAGTSVNKAAPASPRMNPRISPPLDISEVGKYSRWTCDGTRPDRKFDSDCVFLIQ